MVKEVNSNCLVLFSGEEAGCVETHTNRVKPGKTRDMLCAIKCIHVLFDMLLCL